MRILLLLVAVLGVGACSLTTTPVDAPVELRVHDAAYVPGDTLRADVVNHSARPVGYGACAFALEGRTDSGWVTAVPEPQLCILILYVVQPGQSRSVQMPLSPTLPAGTYRMRATIMPDTSLPTEIIHSPPFTVGAAS